MYILVNIADNRIIETLSEIEIVDGKWVKTNQNSFMQLNVVNIVEVESVSENATYYIDETFLTQSEFDKLQKRPAYIERVKELVRVKYPDADTELAILRKHLGGIDVNLEFDAYNQYVEDCKLQAKSELAKWLGV